VAESIRSELEALEQVGRVTAEDHRPVHAEFGFGTVEPDPVRDDSVQDDSVQDPVASAQDPVAVIGGINLATDLDDAWSRLKRSINPE
jgi:hypothetical protein